MSEQRETIEAFVWKGTIFQVRWLGWSQEDSWDVLFRNAESGREFGAHVPLIEHTYAVGDELEVLIPTSYVNTVGVRINGGPLIRSSCYAGYDFVLVPDPEA